MGDRVMGKEDWRETLRRLKVKEDWEGAVNFGMTHLPYPSAFGDVCVCIRKIISKKRKLKEDFTEDIKKLYTLCAYHRFVCRHSEIVVDGEEDPFNYRSAKLAHNDKILEYIDLGYDTIGYEFLDFLNITDVKSIKKLWGEPKKHQDPRTLYAEIWQSYIHKAFVQAEKYFKKERQEESAEEIHDEIEFFIDNFKDELRALDSEYKQEWKDLGRSKTQEDIDWLNNHFSSQINDLRRDWDNEFLGSREKWGEGFKLPYTFESLFHKTVKNLTLQTERTQPMRHFDSLPIRQQSNAGFWITVVFLLILAVYFLSGCATPPGQLKESDLVWQEKTIAANYQEVYRNIKEGFRTCAGVVIESDLYTDKKTGHFDVYLARGSDWVFGLIDLKSITEASTWVKVGVQNSYDSPAFAETGLNRKLWLRWASGDLTCG